MLENYYKYIIVLLVIAILVMAILLARKKNDRLHHVAEVNMATVIGISDDNAAGKIYHIKYNRSENIQLQEYLCIRFELLQVGDDFEVLLITNNAGEIISATNIREEVK